MAHRTRRQRYDLVIDAQGLLRSGVFAWATRAPRRIGHADAAEGGAWWLTERVASDPALHTVDRMMSLLEPLRVPAVMDLCLHTPPTDIVTPDEPYVVVAPTSRWASKRWPIERYDALAERLRSNYRVVVVGGPGERPQCAPLLHRATHDPRVIDCVGQTSVGGLMRLIERSSLVVANDSAALHMAVGFDRPTVALFGPTRVDHVGPYGREADVIQHVRPDEQLDHKRDEQVEVMRRINVDEVLDACNQ
ncbi:MAG: glycosyltransferase family 9 protein, partial [Planctomycetota bacterium]